jgi:hypothetical protein
MIRNGDYSYLKKRNSIIILVIDSKLKGYIVSDPDRLQVQEYDGFWSIEFHEGRT